MSRNPKQAPSAKLSPQDLWKDISLSRSGIDELIKQSQQTGDLRPARAALDDLQLKTSNYEKLVEEMQVPMRQVLGEYFLGTAEWQRSFGAKVGVPPRIPETITVELLNSDCLLHPGQKIKETHILMLIPKTVNGQPYSPLKLDELCLAQEGPGHWMINRRANYANFWRSEAWASTPQSESEWVLIPKSDPDPRGVPNDRHFRGKSITEQAEIYNYYAADYREAKALEVMTAAIYNSLHNDEITLFNFYLRTTEQNADGSRVRVGYFSRDGLAIRVEEGSPSWRTDGVALARKV